MARETKVVVALRKIAALEQTLREELGTVRSVVAAAAGRWVRLETRLTNLECRVARFECEHKRTHTRVYGAHTWQGRVAHLVRVECLDCGKVLHEEPHAVEITGV